MDGGAGPGPGLAEELLEAFAEALGPDLAAYGNHVRRVLAFHQALSGAPSPEAVL